MQRRRGIYPGSFNPPTEAHLRIAERARERHGLDAVVLAVSTVALAKEHVQRPLLRHRIEVLEEVAADHGWLEVELTEQQLLVDIAFGYDVLIMGADKWKQIQDPIYYSGDGNARDRAIANLPDVAIAPRDGIEVPDHLELHVGPEIADVSSSSARDGATRHMCAAARRFDRRTGAWTSPARYERWLETGEAS